MGGFSISHILLLLMVVLLFFGPSKLPQLGKSLGQALRGFKEGMDEFQRETENSASQTPKPQLKPGSSTPSETLAQHEPAPKNTNI